MIDLTTSITMKIPVKKAASVDEILKHRRRKFRLDMDKIAEAQAKGEELFEITLDNSEDYILIFDYLMGRI